MIETCLILSLKDFPENIQKAYYRCEYDVLGTAANATVVLWPLRMPTYGLSYDIAYNYGRVTSYIILVNDFPDNIESTFVVIRTNE